MTGLLSLRKYKCILLIDKIMGLALSLMVLAQVGCGGRGGGVDADGNPTGLGLTIVKVSGDLQGVKKNLDFPVALVSRVTSPDGTPVPEMNVVCRETTDNHPRRSWRNHR